MPGKKTFDKFIVGVQLPPNMDPPARINARINAGTNARKNARKRLRHEDIYEQHTVYYEHKLWELVKNSGETITYEINEALRQYYGVEE